MLTIEELLDTTAARIAALPSGDFDQSGYATGWKETAVSQAVSEGGTPVGHLTFALIIPRSVNTGADQAGFGGEVLLRTPLVVLFDYHIRTGSTSQIPDERLATRAAHQVTKALMRPWPSDTDPSIPDDRVVILVSPWAAAVDGEWCRVTVEVSITHELPLS